MDSENIPVHQKDSGVFLAHAGRIIAAAMLFWALDDHPYSYFTLLRVVVFGVAAFCAVRASEYDRSSWTWIFGGIAVFFNPIWPIRLDRETWQVIDVDVGVVMLVSFFYLKAEKTHKLSKEKGGPNVSRNN